MAPQESSPYTDAERDYRRVLDEVARREVVHAAEDVVTASWISELEQLRIGLLRAADQHELGQVGDVHAGRGEPADDWNRVRRIAEVMILRQVVAQEVAPLLCDVSDALDVARATCTRRIRHRAEDLERLRVSRERAYGKN